MKARLSSAVSRCLFKIHHWLRHTWLSRLPLLERGQAWLARPHRPRTARRWRPRQVYPSLETLETRWAATDPLGACAAPLAVSGLVLMPVGVVTPVGVLVKGWPSGVAAPDLTAANTDLRLAPASERDRLADAEVTSLFAAWSQTSLVAGTSQADGGQEAAGDAGRSRVASGGDVDREFLTAADRTEEGLGGERDSLAGPKPPSSRWHPSGGGTSSSPNAHADSGGSGPGGRSTPTGGGGGGGGGGGSLNANAPNLAALSQMLPNGNPAFISPAGTTGGTASPQGQSASAATPAVASAQANALVAASSDPGSGANAAAFSSVAQNFGNTPLPYVPNEGQIDNPLVNFVSQGGGFELFLTPTGATFDVPVASQNSTTQTPPTPGQPATPPQFDAFTMQLTGANANPTILAQDQLPSTSNYFIGNDPSQWRTDVANYGSVEYDNIYPGVNLVYSSVNTNFEYAFVVQPGDSVSEIQQTWQGVTSASIDRNGNLVLQTPGGPVVQQAPTVYQLDASGYQVPVSVTQVVTNGNQTSFQVGAYDATKPLIIDPSIVYSTYLGGNLYDQGNGIAVDGAGNTYVTGITFSSNFPTQSGLQSSLIGRQDVFVTKLNSSGGLMYSTYLGGSGGSGTSGGASIAVDLAGNTYLTGYTDSTNFPTTPGALQSTGSGFREAFVSKLNASGNTLLASTYFTAVGAAAVALDASDDAFITGSTTGSLPRSNGSVFQSSFGGGSSDAFIAELDPNLTTLVYSSYLGGSNNDVGNGVTVDSSGNAYVTGYTLSSDFPTTTGALMTTAPTTTTMAFVTKVAPGGATLVYSTYLSGNSPATQGNAIAVDRSGDAFMTGWTSSSNFPTTVGAFQSTLAGSQHAFVSELDSTGSTLVYSSYLGGSNFDSGLGIALDTAGEAFVTGFTDSTDFPTTVGAFQSRNGSSTADAFITKVNPAGSTLVYSSYLGGSAADIGTAVAVDPFGNAYLTGYTDSTNFPTVNAYQSRNGGSNNYDAFVAKILPTPAPPVFTGITPDTGEFNNDQLTNSQHLHLLGTAPPGATVTLYQAGVGQIGTTVANATTGTWSYDDSGTTLPEGVTAFTATDSLGSFTSASSPDFLVTVDLTPPNVTASVPTMTTSLAPKVRVTATDLNGVAPTVTLVVDNNSAYATGTLVNGTALITLPALSSTGLHTLTAEVDDRAGNLGTSATMTFQVNPVSTTGTITAQVLSSDPVSGMSQQQLGDVTLSHALDLDQSPGTQQSGSPAIVYNSDSVNLDPIVQATIPTANNQALPTTITAQLTFNGVTGPIGTYTTTGFSAGDILTVAQQSATLVLASGRYAWSLQVTLDYATPQTQTVTGVAYEVTQDGSPFGSGWTFSPVDQLVTITQDANGPAGELREYGTGEWRFYTSTGGGNYTSPTGDNGTLTFAGGSYTYQTPDGQTTAFNGAGQETSWTSADGQQSLQYRYNGSLLTGMTAIDGALSTFTYSGGLLSTIQTVNGRTTSFAYSGTNLTQITNPDSKLHTFSYDSGHHLTGETFGDLQNGWAYTSAGTVGTFTWGSPTGTGGQTNPSNFVINPAVVQGLNSLVAGTVQATVTDPDQHTTTWQFDAQGRPLQQVAADGGVTQWQYTNGYVTTQIDPLGRTTTFARDAQGYVTLETLPDTNTISMQYQSAFHALTTSTNERGFTSTYAYDSQGHLTSQTDALGDTTTYSYSSNGLLTTVTDALSHTTTYKYDINRRLTQVSDALSKLTTFTYDLNGNPQTTKDALSRVTTTVYDVMGRLQQTIDPLTEITTLTEDEADLELTQTNPNGQLTSLVYDGFSRGLVATVYQATGSPVQSSTITNYDSAGYKVGVRNPNGWWTTFTYDAVGRPIQTLNAQGGTTQKVYDLAGEVIATRDELGNWTKQAYNARGWVTQSTDALGEITTFAYDQAGNLIAVTDPLTHTTTTQYDQLNRPTSVQDALNHFTTTTYDKVGNISSVRDVLNHVTSYGYDKDNRLTKVTEAVGFTVQRTTTTVYDAVGNVTSQIDGLGHITTTMYDKANRATAVEDALLHFTTMMYDKVGNTTSITDALNKTTTFIYDQLNHLVATTDPLNHTTTNIVDSMGNVVATIDPLGDTTQTIFDSLNRPIATVDGQGGLNQTQYDAAGSVVAVIDADGNQTSFLYDPLNRQIRQTDPYGNITTTTYDLGGRVQSVKDPDNRTITYSYDSLNRVTASTWLSSTGSVVNTITYSYDAKGNLLTAANSTGTDTFTYDALDRVATQKDLYGLTLTYSYDKADRLTQRQDSLGGLLTSVYDNADRLTARKLTAGGQTLMLDPGYNNRNDLTSLTRFADLAGTTVLGTSVYSYDDAGRLTSIVNQNGSSTTLSYYNYGYDNANRVTSEAWNSQVGTFVYSGTHSYSYDRASQLLGDGTSTFSYDPNGNRTMTGYQTVAANRLSTDGTFTYSYDNAGNEIQKTNGTSVTWTYGYDNRNELVSVQETLNGAVTLTVNYKYDVFGSRVEEDKWQSATGTVVMRHAYDGQNVWADLTSTNTVTARYVYGNRTDQIWARMVPSGQTNAGVAWYLTDLLGSVTDLMDGTQALRDHLDYNGYGGVTESNLSFGDRYKYTAREYDTDTGLQENRSRYYDPLTGRWLELDPQSFRAGDTNLYRYDSNNPVNTTDPNGQIAFTLGFGITGFVGGFVYGGLTGEGGFDLNKALAAGVSGLLVGAALGSAIDTAGASLGVVGALAASTASGAAFGAGVGSAIGGNLLANGQGVNWSGYVEGGAKGAAVGAVAGLAGGGAGIAVSRGVTALLGQGLTGTATSVLSGGFAGGFVGDQAAQGFAIGLGWQNANDYGLRRSLIAGGIGAALSAAGAGYKAWRQSAAPATNQFQGTAKPWTQGATPNSTYTQISPKTGKALQNAIYDQNGNVIGHVDFKNHGPGALSGHGHQFPQPGNPASGHGPGMPHIPNNQLPPGWDTLPPGVQPHTPIGQ